MFAQNTSQGGHRSHLRFYIFMVTLVLGGLFFLLFMNDQESSGTGFISAITGYSANFSETLSPQDPQENVDQELNQLITEGNKVKYYRSVPLSVLFSQIPVFEKEAVIDLLELEFDDLSTTITVNGDNLELKNLKEVKLSIQDFIGNVNLKQSEFSVTGTAKRIEVNGVAFSSEKDLPVSFHGLNYKQIKLSNIELKDLDLRRGSGELKVGEKLRYSLEDEELKVLYFKGLLSVNRQFSNQSELLLEGDVKGLYSDGDLLTFTLR